MNNKELNTRKFNDKYSHILNASKAKGAKFTKQEVSMSLTPPFADQQNAGVPTDLQLLMASDSSQKQSEVRQDDLLNLNDSSSVSKQSNAVQDDQHFSSSCSSSGHEMS